MIVLAHRGFHTREQTENTLDAFRAAIHEGADGIELDLRLSKDDELVVVHDSNLHRVAGDAHKVAELTASELGEIALRFGGKVPTLDDVTSHIHSPVVLDLEVKVRDAIQTVIRKLDTSSSLRQRTIVSSYHPSVLLEVRKRLPDVRTLLLVSRWPLPLRRARLWSRIDRIQPWGVAFPLAFLTQSRVVFLRQRGFHVGGWDWHDRALPGDARKAVRLGLDFAIVKHVRQLRSLLSRQTDRSLDHSTKIQ